MDYNQTTKRLFLSLEVPEHVKQRIGEFAKTVPGLQPHPAKNFHVTIKFLGDVDGEQEEMVMALMDFLCSVQPPFPLEFFGMKAMEARLRLLVTPSEALHFLYQNTVHNLKKINLYQEDRIGFEPHVTVGRAAAIEVSETAFDYGPLSFVADTLVLYQTVKGQSHAEFVPLKKSPFSKTN